MDVHLAEPSRRFWGIPLAVPHAVEDADNRVFDVLHLESEGFLEPKTRPRQQGIEDLILPLSLRDDRVDLPGRNLLLPGFLDSKNAIYCQVVECLFDAAGPADFQILDALILP